MTSYRALGRTLEKLCYSLNGVEEAFSKLLSVSLSLSASSPSA
jgi:hypothetical protein